MPLTITHNVDCAWARDLKAPNSVIDWLSGIQAEAPKETWEYLDKINKHNDLYESYCK